MILFIARINMPKDMGTNAFIFNERDMAQALARAQKIAHNVGGVLEDVEPAEDYIGNDIHELSLWKAWMTPTTGRKWIGCDGTNSFTSTKAKVANWCIDQAVNGPA